jgi:hypothetical protein
MIKAIANSGPFIHLASIGQIDLLRQKGGNFTASPQLPTPYPPHSHAQW